MPISRSTMDSIFITLQERADLLLSSFSLDGRFSRIDRELSSESMYAAAFADVFIETGSAKTKSVIARP